MNSSSPDGSRFIKFFAIFDGHGGLGCAEFLRDNLHNYIASSPNFPSKLDQAIKEGCAEAENTWMR
jgi:serine/threonine protein phosphatase PrpC